MQTARWSPCSQVMLFATEEEPLLYALKFVNATLFAGYFLSNEKCFENQQFFDYFDDYS